MDPVDMKPSTPTLVITPTAPTESVKLKLKGVSPDGSLNAKSECTDNQVIDDEDDEELLMPLRMPSVCATRNESTIQSLRALTDRTAKGNTRRVQVKLPPVIVRAKQPYDHLLMQKEPPSPDRDFFREGLMRDLHAQMTLFQSRNWRNLAVFEDD